MELSEFSIDELKYAINNYGINDEGVLQKSIKIDSLGGSNSRIVELFQYNRSQIIDEFRNREKAIYGVDERHDLYQIKDENINKISKGVCAIIETNALSDNGNGTTSLHGQSYKDRFNLCPTERFINQLSIATGTAFLIDYSMVVTAGHCIEENNIFRYKFVFDFETTSDGSTRTIIENSNIFSGTRIIGRRFESSGIDWAVVQLDRPALNKNILKLNLINSLSVGASVYCIGHPSGLPKKAAINGNVQEQHTNHFVANVDTYAGNSGSPVINSQSHLVEGILVRGEVDFLNTGTCNVSNRCMSNNCRGEHVFKPNDFSHLIPNQTTPGFYFNNAEIRILGSTIILKEGEILDYTGKENSLQRAFDIIKYFNFNFKGDVNCGGKYLSYYLSNGEAPTGNFPSGEDQIPFNRKEIEIRMLRSMWKLMEPNHLILDFEENQEQARHALSIILKHEFNYICFVGRPHSPLIYFKK